jgi:hypothetical protein
MDICTIFAKNYLAQARVLANSFLEHNPGGRCFALLIDDIDGYIDPAQEPFTILTPAEIGCEPFAEMAARYEVLELSTAVKPWLLAHLLDRRGGVVSYLDPDIYVCSSLERLETLARAHDIVLTPHLTRPLPDDGLRPNSIDILLAGVHNLGFVSLRASDDVARLLCWWRQRLLHDCRIDPFNGYFVDQRWFDLAPGFVSERALVRDPEFNLAYWNLPMRHLTHDGGYSVEGRELAFFHFSGFDADAPATLSRYQSRVSVEPGTALARICTEYAEALLAAGYRTAKHWPYSYGQLPIGVPFNRMLRWLHDRAVTRGEVAGSPFTEEGCAAFLAWLAVVEPGAPRGVNRLLAELHDYRDELRSAFPDLAGADRRRFLRWARRDGVVEQPLLGLLADAPDLDGAGRRVPLARGSRLRHLTGSALARTAPGRYLLERFRHFDGWVNPRG